MTIRKRPRTTLDAAVLHLSHRELGQLSSTKFSRRLAASEDLVLRFDILRKLDKHHGCVNTVSFNAPGDVLLSGSDDTRVILWDWETGHVKLSFYSGHENNVFQAKFIPYTDDRSIVTCAADGKVMHAQILESGVKTKLLAEHQGRVHKLALVPESPQTFYTCAEDGLVQHIDLRTGTATALFCCRAFHSQSSFNIVSLNAIAIDPRNPNLFAVGGSDQFARLFDIRQYRWDASSELDRPVDSFCPPHLVKDEHEHVGITGLAFSDQSELLVSYNDEFIYLFTKDMGLGPDPTITTEVSDGSDADDMTPDNSVDLSLSKSNENVKAAPQAYTGHRNSATVKGVNFFGPKCDYVVSGSDCGRIFIWKKKGGELVRAMEADKRIVNCIESHPHATVLASSGIESDIKIWVPTAVDKATLPTNIEKDRIHPFYGCCGYDDEEDEDDFIYFDDDTDDDDDDGKEDEDEVVFDDSDEDEEDYSDDSDDSGSLENDDSSRNEDGEGDGKSDFIFGEDMDEHDDFGSESSDDDDETEGKIETEELDAATDVSRGHDVAAVFPAKANDNP